MSCNVHVRERVHQATLLLAVEASKGLLHVHHTGQVKQLWIMQSSCDAQKHVLHKATHFSWKHHVLICQRNVLAGSSCC